jgi:L-lactate utilization protein LutC
MSPETVFETISETLSETVGGPKPALPAPWQSRRTFSDPVRRFCEALEAAHGEPVVVGSLGGALGAAAGILDGLGAGLVVANSEPPLDGLAPGNGSAWRVERAGSYEANPDGWRDRCARADAGVTSADALLAETGSLVISSGPGRSRLPSLLPPVHIAVVPTGRLTTDLFTWLETRPKTWAANTVLVSGPSKTGDIEQTLSVGVHGPKRLVVVLYPF